MSRRGALALFIATALATPGAAIGGAAAPAKEKAKADETTQTLYDIGGKKGLFSFDYGPPKSPALSLLGSAGDSITPSTSLTKFVLSIPTVLDGKAGQTIAFDGAPAAIWQRPENDTFSRYIRDGAEGRAYRLMHRTRVGVAAMTGDDAGGDASKAVRSRLAFGFSASLLDQADPIVTGGRDADGQPLLLRCLAELTPPLQNILERAAQTTPEQTLLHRRRLAFETAGRDLGLIRLPNEPEKAPNFKDARADLEEFLPGATADPPPQKPNAPTVRKPGKKELAIAQKIAALKASGGLSADAEALLNQMLELIVVGEASDPPAPAPAPAPQLLADADILAAVQRELKALNAEGEEEDLGAPNAKAANEAIVKAGLDKAFVRCSTLASRTARFSADLDVGAGVLWRGEPGSLNKLDPGGRVVWLSYKHPIHVFFPKDGEEDANGAPLDPALPKSAWTWAVSGRYSRGEFVQTKDKVAPEFKADILDYWLGVERLSETNRFAFQYGWHDIDARMAIGKPFAERGERYLFTAQFKTPALGEGAWLGLTYGNAYGSADKLDDVKALVTLSYTPPPPINISRDK